MQCICPLRFHLTGSTIRLHQDSKLRGTVVTSSRQNSLYHINSTNLPQLSLRDGGWQQQQKCGFKSDFALFQSSRQTTYFGQM